MGKTCDYGENGEHLPPGKTEAAIRARRNRQKQYMDFTQSLEVRGVVMGWYKVVLMASDGMGWDSRHNFGPIIIAIPIPTTLIEVTINQMVLGLKRLPSHQSTTTTFEV